MDANLVGGLVKGFLQRNYDSPKPIPKFHFELWDLACDESKQYVAAAAPRGHAKSTAITGAFALAAVLMRWRDHVLLVSDTETQSSGFLKNIYMELTENARLIEAFKFSHFEKDAATELVGVFTNGDKFRILARGSNQKLRGLTWRNKRPNLILCDDLENDDIVLNEETRTKFSKWFMEALIPSGSDDVLVRVVGTILHLGSLLESLMPPLDAPDLRQEGCRMWVDREVGGWWSVRYRAHNEDFSDILWPEKFSQERLTRLRSMYVSKGNSTGYAKEYLNYPIDKETAYFQENDLRDVNDIPKWQDEEMVYYVGCDFAISNRDRAAFTALVVAGIPASGAIRIVDVRRFRGDAKKIVDEMFSINDVYRPDLFIIEKENIARSLGPFIEEEMQKRGFFAIEEVIPTKDKEQRARPLQARARTGSFYVDKSADWYPAYANELLSFPAGAYMDQVDATAHIGATLDKLLYGRTAEEIEDDEYEDELEEAGLLFMGRNIATGY